MGWLRAVAALAVVMTLTAAQAQVPEREKVTVAVGGKATLYYLPLTIAERLGLFRKHGLTVEILDFEGGSRALQAVVGGSADVVSGAYEHTIRLQARGQALRAFVLMGRAPQLAVLVRTADAAAYRSARDLAGKPVGVSAPGSSSHMLVNVLLKQAGASPKDVSIVGIGSAPAQGLAAFANGKVPAQSTAEPIISLLEREGQGRVVADTRTAAGTEAIFGGPMPAASLYAPQAFLDRNPVTVERLARAIVEALAFIREATDDRIVDVVPPEYLLGDRDLYRRALAGVRDAYSPDGLMPAAGPATALAALKTVETAIPLDGIDLPATYTNAVVERLRAGKPGG